MPNVLKIYQRTDLTATCEIDPNGLDQARELPMTISVTDTAGMGVFKAVITMHLSLKKPKN